MTMTTTDDAPRIYVASLTDYNAGRLHGIWLDLDGGDPDEIADTTHEAIRAMLAEGQRLHPEDGPYEEWAVHDFEGFHGLDVSEWCDISQVARWAAAITEHGPAVAAYLANNCGDLDQFEEAYQGEWSSREEFAQQLAEDIGYEQPEGWPGSYIDWETAARDLFLSGDYWDHDLPTGGIYVFDGRI